MTETDNDRTALRELYDYFLAELDKLGIEPDETTFPDDIMLGFWVCISFDIASVDVEYNPFTGFLEISWISSYDTDFSPASYHFPLPEDEDVAYVTHEIKETYHFLFKCKEDALRVVSWLDEEVSPKLTI